MANYERRTPNVLKMLQTLSAKLKEAVPIVMERDVEKAKKLVDLIKFAEENKKNG